MNASPKTPADISGALRKLSNFCLTYSEKELADLSSRSFGALVGGGYPNLSSRERERLLDYFEALEELTGELHRLNSFMQEIGKQ